MNSNAAFERGQFIWALATQVWTSIAVTSTSIEHLLCCLYDSVCGDMRTQDPDDFCYTASKEQDQLRQRLVAATKQLKSVHMPPDVRLKISEICSLLDVDGIRGDIVTNRAAKALVAFEGRDEVSMADVEKVIGLCLNHRWDWLRCCF